MLFMYFVDVFRISSVLCAMVCIVVFVCRPTIFIYGIIIFYFVSCVLYLVSCRYLVSALDVFKPV